MAKETNHEATSAAEIKEHKPRLTMVPIFSWRTVISVILGLIVGAALGLGYWIISPSLNVLGSQAGAGSEGFMQSMVPPESTTDVPWSSKVYIQVVNPGSDYMSMRDLQSKGEYYSAKVNSLPFLEFLSQELDKQAPQYSQTPDDLDDIMRVRYNPNVLDLKMTTTLESSNPAIEVKVTGASAQEALFLSKFVPEAFKNFLIAEEKDKQNQDYENTLKEIETVKASLYVAEKEIEGLTSQDIFNDPNYIALNSRVESLQRELDTQAVELNNLITLGSDIQQEYETTLQQATDVNNALIEANKKLEELEGQSSDVDTDISHDKTYITLNAKITGLEGQLNRLMTGWTEGDFTSMTKYIGLAEMIANGDTTSEAYQSRLKEVERVSTALSESKKELVNLKSPSGENSAPKLDYRLAKIQVDILSSELSALEERLALLARENVNGDSRLKAQEAFDKTAIALSEAKNELANLESQLGYDRLAMDLDYQVAMKKTDELNVRLDTLTQKLSSTIGTNTESLEMMTNSLVAGNPSMPSPVLPSRMKVRNALMMGAIVGIGGAWVLLNFRWIAKGMPSSDKTDEDEE